MIRTLQLSVGVVSAMFALLMLGLCLIAASSTQHTLRSSERTHLEAVVQFAREQERTTGVIPEAAEFEIWAREMDLKGFRFDGNGFALDKRCGSAPTEFCVSFSTGDGFVTYRSWQQSMDKARFDKSPIPLALVLLVVAVGSAILSKLLLAPTTVHTDRLEAHEG